MKEMFRKACKVAALLVLLGVLTGPALARLGVISPLAGFGLFAISCLLSVPLAMACIVLFARGGTKSERGILMLAVVLVGYLVYALVSLRDYPPINDISTEVLYPPEFVHALTLPENDGRDLSFPAENGNRIRDAYPEVRTLAVMRSAANIYKLALGISKSQEGWTVTDARQSNDEWYVEGYAVTKLFGFHDDFVVRVSKVDEDSCVVDMRSKSRDGQGDLGANARRIRDFLTKLESP